MSTNKKNVPRTYKAERGTSRKYKPGKKIITSKGHTLRSRTVARSLTVKRNQLGETPKQTLADPRLGKLGVTKSMTMSQVENDIGLISVLDSSNLQAFAVGYVSRAVMKGYATVAQYDANIYLAYQYLVYLLQQYANGAPPPSTKLPYVVLCMARTLTSKTPNFANGKVTYSFSVEQVVNNGAAIPIGYGGYGYVANLGYVSQNPALVNKFPVITIPNTAPFDVVASAKAFTNMNSYLANHLGMEDFRLVDNDIPTPFDKECSAFAVTQMPQGLGFANKFRGGVGGQAQLEVPLHRPMLTLMNPTSNGTQNYRYGVFTNAVAGDPCVLGGMVGTAIPLRHLSMKRYPKFHFVDLNEFIEVLAMWVQQLQQQAVGALGVINAQPPASYGCPLTLLDLSLLLRNVFMEAFQESQVGCQGLYPVQPNSSTDNQFVPLVASVGTCFLRTVGFSMPKVFIENIRALVMRVALRSKTDPEYFIPVIGIYNNDIINPQDFTYQTPDGTLYPCFAVDSAIYTKTIRRKDGTLVEEPYVQTPVSLVDGSSSDGYVAINDPPRLTTLAAMWEKWLTGSQLTQFSLPLGKWSTENGINILYSGNMTRRWTTSTAQQILERKRQTEGKINSKREQEVLTNAVTASPYLARVVYADCVQSVPLNAAYSTFQSNWIIPQVVLVGGSDPEDPNSTLIQRWQALMSEPYNINASVGYGGIAYAELHYRYASFMTRGNLAPATDWAVFLDEMEKTGRGGFLSNLVAGAISSFSPTLGAVASSIANTLPV